MWRNFSPYSLSVKSRLTLLFEIYKGFNNSDRLAWELSWLGKKSHATICLRGRTMFFLLTVIAILVNELPRKMNRCQVIMFTQ